MSVRRASLIGLLLTSILVLSNQAYAAGDRYIIGDGLGNMTVQIPRPSIWSGPGTEGNFSGDSVYGTGTSTVATANRMSFKCEYNLNTKGADSLPAKWNGFGWYFLGTLGPQDFTGAEYLRFAYKLPNPKHLLRINIQGTDKSTIISIKDTTITDTTKTPDSTYTRKDTTFRMSYVPAYIKGGVGSAGLAGWVLDSIPISAWGPDLVINGVTQVDFNQIWADTSSPTIDTTGGEGIIELDEVCFTNVASVTVGTLQPLKSNIKPVVSSTGLTFTPTSTGSVTAKFFSMQGQCLSTLTIDVTAGKSVTLSQQMLSQHAAGAYLVHVTGAGVDHRARIAR